MATEHYDGPEPVNGGIGEEIKISGLAVLAAEICGFTRAILCDLDQPDGQSRRRLDTSRTAALFGFRATTGPKERFPRDGRVVSLGGEKFHRDAHLITVPVRQSPAGLWQNVQVTLNTLEM